MSSQIVNRYLSVNEIFVKNRMETRAAQQHKYLKIYLEEQGLYERGMSLDDMRQVYQAILESLGDSGFDIDMEIALKESEDEYMQEIVHNSTMNSDANYSNSQTTFNSYNTLETGYSTESARSSSPPSSPDGPQTILVRAQVHHELNYDPKSDPDSVHFLNQTEML